MQLDSAPWNRQGLSGLRYSLVIMLILIHVVTDQDAFAAGWPRPTKPIDTTGSRREKSEGTSSPREVFLYQVGGESSDEGTGETLFKISDIDGDLYPDLVVGAPFASPPDMFHGGLVRCISGATGSELYRISGDTPGMELGASITSPGDLNGDGIPDVVLGAPGAAPLGIPNAGAILAFDGQTAELLWRVDEPAQSSRLGTDLDFIEDFDRDGVPDILACGPGIGPSSRGRFFLISGASGRVLKRVRFGFAGDETGASLAVVSDLDGDERPEILVGAPGANNDTGLVYVISRQRTPYLTISGDTPGQRFGTGLCGIEDRNGDGTPDLVIGAPGTGTIPGTVHLVSGLDGTSITTLISHPDEGFGSTLDASQDFDGAGVADILIGAPTHIAASGESAGSVSVFSGENFTLLTMIEGTSSGERLGTAITTLPDLSNDGRSELVMGSPGASRPCVTTCGIARVVSLADHDTILYELSADSFNPLGSSVHSAGDVNGDNISDFIVGVPLEDPDQLHNAGSAYIFSGKDGQLLRQFAGENEGDRFGTAVRGVTDLDGDGLNEIAIGAPGGGSANNGISGYVDIYSVMTGVRHLRLIGQQDGDLFGTSLGASHDYDGDLVPDLLVGSPGATVLGLQEAGRVEAFSLTGGTHLLEFVGSSSEDHLGSSVTWIDSLDGDGIPDIIVGAPNSSPASRLQSGVVFIVSGANLLPLRSYVGENFFDHFGTSVAAVGDVDQDGISDYLVGAPDGNPRGLADAGSAFLYSGSTGNLIDRHNGEDRGDRAGVSLEGTGDADGDGIPDYVIGMSGASVDGRQGAGKIVLYSGSEGTPILVHGGSDAGQALGDAVATAGDVDGDSFPEIIAGGSGLGNTGNGGIMVVLDPVVPRYLRARVGNVNKITGVPSNTLLVNGSFGHSGRRYVDLSLGEPFAVNLIDASGGPTFTGPASYVVYFWDGEPNSTTVTPNPFELGDGVFPNPFTGGSPQPILELQSFDENGCLGGGLQPSLNSVVYSLPEGFLEATTMTIQAIVADPGSVGSEGLSLTNAVIVRVQ